MGKEVRVVFCDTKKAFDRVWHGGLIYKLKAAGVKIKVLKWFTHYLTERNQLVIFATMHFHGIYESKICLNQ